MQRFAAFLLLSVLMISNPVASEDSSLKTTKCAVLNQLMKKVDNISSELKHDVSGFKTETSVISHLMTLSSKMATVETQLKVEIQTSRDELQKTKADLQLTKDELKNTKLDQQDELQRIRAGLQVTKDELKNTKANLQVTKDELQNAKEDQQVTKSEVELLRSRESNPGSSSFIRWGRKSCPGNTTLVYSGVAGGKHFQEKGSGTNRLCLSRQPEFDNNINPPFWGHLYGAEYENMVGHHQHDVPCSVCRAPESTTIMVPGTRTCPPTWTRQYHGHLISQYHGHFASDYVCLDHKPEADASGVLDQHGNLYYYTKTRCGSLPCPPYVNNKVVTCVVCSK